jgi:hypothetical protein
LPPQASQSVSAKQPVHSGPGIAAGVRRTKGMRRGSPTPAKAAPTAPNYLRAAEVADLLHLKKRLACSGDMIGASPGSLAG